MSNRPADILLSSETENILEIEHSLRGGGGSPVKFGQIKEIKSEEKKGNHQWSVEPDTQKYPEFSFTSESTEAKPELQWNS